jgi:hypothetical protein
MGEEDHGAEQDEQYGGGDSTWMHLFLLKVQSVVSGT